jgi:hypothetical protein
MNKHMLATIITGVTVLLAWTVIAINESSASESASTSTTTSITVTAPTVEVAAPAPAPTTTTTTATLAPASVQQETPAPQISVPPTDGCWMDLARQVGWPEETLGHLHYIIQRESRCDPTAYANRPSTMDNSRGLLQINSYGSLDGAVRRLCGIDPEQLFDPAINLTCGLAYYHNAGWTPWGG